MSIDNEEPGNAVEGGERSTQEQLISDQQRHPRPLSQQSTLVGTPSDLGALDTDYQNDFSLVSPGSEIPDRQPLLPFDLPPTSSLGELEDISQLVSTNLSQPDIHPGSVRDAVRSQFDDNRVSQELVEERHSLEPSTLEPSDREAAFQLDWPHSHQPSGRSTPEIHLSQATDVETGFDEAPPRPSDGPGHSSQAPSPIELISSVAFDEGRSNLDNINTADSRSNQLKRSRSSSEPPPQAKRPKVRGDDLDPRVRSPHSR